MKTRFLLNDKIRLLHIITDLSTGGAEIMLYKLLTRMDKSEFAHSVISLTDMGDIAEKIQALGIPVRALGMKRGMPNPLLVFKLAQWLRLGKPDLIQTWMYHADLVGGLAASLAKGIPVVWGIRHTNLDPSANKWTTIQIAKVCAYTCTLFPRKIICCSDASLQAHSAMGYCQDIMQVIPNGFDIAVFVPNPAARDEIHAELGVERFVRFIGLVARFDPQKDHHNFFQAAGILSRDHPDVHFVLCGDGITRDNTTLWSWVLQANVEGVTHLLGRRSDMPRLTAAFDIASSSSLGEGFPNAIGEAMACAVPCVVTDVGDSAYIVGDTGLVVPPKNPKALAEAWRKMLALPKEELLALGKRARKRIKENFEIGLIVERYEQVYREIINFW